MSNVVKFPVRRKPKKLDPAIIQSFRLDDNLSVSDVIPRHHPRSINLAITGPLAAAIENAALWAGKPPERYVADWLAAGFLASEMREVQS